MNRRSCINLVFASLLAAAGWAVAAGGIVASSAWSRPTPPGISAGVVYLAIRNDGATPDRLIGMSTPIAERVELHQTVEHAGTMSMQPLAALDIPAHASVEAKPGAIHVMLLGLKNPLTAGSRFALTLKFEHAAPITVDVSVRAEP